MTHRNSMFLSVLVLFVFAGGAQAVQVTRGVTLNWVPQLDFNNNGFLDSTLNRQNNRRFNFPGGNAPYQAANVLVNDVNLPGVSHALRLPINGNGGTMPSLNNMNFPGANPTNEPATFEIAFRTPDFNDRHVLFETGGNGDGLAFFLEGDNLIFQAQDANNNNQRGSVSVTLDSKALNTMQHAVGTVDPFSDTLQLFLNGQQVNVTNIPGTFNDWAGGDGSGLGRQNGSITGGGSTTAFNGDIGLLRYYRGGTFSQFEASNNYQALQSIGGAAALNFDANDDLAPGVWEDGNFYFSQNFDWQTGANPLVAVSPRNVGITQAYRFDGTAGATSASHIEQLPGNATNDSASFELWFKPADVMSQQVLLDIGGGVDGTSFTINNGVLQFVAKDNADTAGLFAPIGDLDDYIHAVGVVDLDSDLIALFINGEVAGITGFVGNDWAGSDAIGLGSQAGGAVGGSGGAFGNLNNYGNFVGDISINRFFSFALTEGQVAGAFSEHSPIPEPASALLLGLASLGLVRRRRRCAA